MRRDDAFTILANHKDELQELGVAALYLIGPITNGDAPEDSDLEVLVELARPMGFFGFFEIEDRLTQWLHQQVHLIDADALQAAEREHVFSEAVRAA